MKKNRLKIAIIEKGETTKSIAEKLSINPQTITNWCNNRNIDNIYKFSELCEKLDKHPNEIFPDIKKQE